ncbi:TPA: C40 family peptidase [Pseudomonas putida]|nr:C40 family peptidase [Pseudomonas putida]
MGSIALDSHADDLDRPAWLSLNERVFDDDPVLVSNSVLPDKIPTLRRSTSAAEVPKAAQNPLQLTSASTLSENEDTSDSSQRVIQRAKKLIGKPYKWGGMSEADGFDCSGLLVYLFRNEAGVELPRTTTSMIREDFQRVSRDELQPGDAVFFNHDGRGPVSHVGLYIGHNRFIHAPRTGQSIRVDSLDNRYWSSRYSSARRFDDESST